MISISSVVFASTIVDSTYGGQGFKSFMGGTNALPGSNIAHNSTFTSSVDINISGDIAPENFTGISDLSINPLDLKNNQNKDIQLKNTGVSIDSGYLEGDILHLQLSGSYEQHITSSDQLSSIFNFDNVTLTELVLDYDSKSITAK